MLHLTVAVLDVQHAVLLEDRTEHGLHNHARGRVRDERRLLVQLLGEQVDTEVAVLAGSRRRRDADHLAGAALEDQEVAEPDVMARDRDRVWRLGDIMAGALAESDGIGAGVFVVLVRDPRRWERKENKNIKKKKRKHVQDSS